MTEVDINDADGKSKSKASPTSNLLPSDALPPCINIPPPSDRKEAGNYWLDEDKGGAPKAKRHKGSMFSKPNVKGKKAYDDCVNDSKKAASDALDRAETYFQAVKRANKNMSPFGELPEVTELFKLMHNKYAQLLGDFNLGIMRRGNRDFCGIGITNLGSKVTKVTTAPLQAKPLEIHQKEWKNILMG